MSNNLRDNIIILKFIGDIKNKRLRRRIIYEIKKPVYNALHEIATNLIHKNIKLSNLDVKKLKKYKKVILKLSSMKTPKKKIIVQSGGMLPALIPLVISTLDSLV